MSPVPSPACTGATAKVREPWVSTANPCHQCRPLGATIAFQGVEGCVPFLHGSQGCATYMRRYLISHFREPVDIASSSVAEKEAVWGGGPALRAGLRNVAEKYGAQVLGLATTCLTETTGESLPMIVSEWKKDIEETPMSVATPEVVSVPCPSYDGTHTDGFNGAVRALVEHFATDPVAPHGGTALFPGFVSPADLRHLREILAAFGLTGTLVPDYADRLDGPALAEAGPLPEGGTTVADLRALPGSRIAIEFGRTTQERLSGAALLKSKWKVPRHKIGLPVGIRESDVFCSLLEEITGRETSREMQLERGRLIDACVDAHKYLSGRKAVVFGDEDLAVGLVAFLTEIGIHTTLVVSGGKSGKLQEEISRVTRSFLETSPRVLSDADFRDLEECEESMTADLFVGHSKGYKLARKRDIPLVRVGFPLHDRFGGQRVLHLGWKGSLELLDRIVNAILEKRQDDSPVGYAYL
ncbi:MAG TPA: nitrogenase component 1 [Fibrobacteria bacterium]|nr:nitrogenase component 1 [Fibrobacteria bacterium]